MKSLGDAWVSEGKPRFSRLACYQELPAVNSRKQPRLQENMTIVITHDVEKTYRHHENLAL